MQIILIGYTVLYVTLPIWFLNFLVRTVLHALKGHSREKVYEIIALN
jgi:hypothetical protein